MISVSGSARIIFFPCPEDMRIKSDASLSSGGGKSRKRKGGGVRIGEHNHGRGGKSRN